MTPFASALTSKTVEVPLTPTAAFTLFTSKMATWWPQSGPQLHLAPYKGGDITETGPDGTPVVRGRVLAFDPDGFLAFSWHPIDHPEHETIVTVVFSATTTGCRVDLTHGSDAVLGPVADAISTSYLRNFDLVLGSFCTCANRVTIAA